MVHRTGLAAGLVVLATMVPRAASAEPSDEHLLLGASVWRLGPGFPHDASGGGWSDPPSYGAGPAIGVTAGYRWDWFVLGVTYQHGFVGGGTWEVKTDTMRTLSASSDYGAVDLIAITAPRAWAAAYFHLALGARFMTYTVDEGAGSAASSAGYLDPDVLLGLGLEFHFSCLRLVPEADVGGGPLGVYSQLGVSLFFDVATPP